MFLCVNQLKDTFAKDHGLLSGIDIVHTQLASH